MKYIKYIALVGFFVSSSSFAGEWGNSGRKRYRTTPATSSPNYSGGYSGKTTGSCRITNSQCSTNSFVKVDVASKCMCLGRKCFKIGRGRRVTQTYNGTATLGLVGNKYDRRGGKYRTRSSTSTGADDDAIRMGIPSNDKYGIWIHKPMVTVRGKGRVCVPAHKRTTLGCVAVPCDMWPQMKRAMRARERITVCGGAGANRTYGRSTKMDRGLTPGYRKSTRKRFKSTRRRYHGKATTGRPSLKAVVDIAQKDYKKAEESKSIR